MRTSILALLFIPLAAVPGRAGVPRFEAKEIDKAAGEVCYALAIADVNRDGKPDIVVATEDAILWYANPTWARGTIVRGMTRPDNVCLQSGDVDGDGRVDFAVGSGWGPLGLRGTEELVWVSREAGSERWRATPVAAVPSLHRVTFGDALGSGHPQLFAAPLQGRGVKEPDWGAGPGVQIRMFRAPGRPGSESWTSEVVDEGLHTAHGLQAVDLDGDGLDELLVAAWEGIFVLRRDREGHWSRLRIGAGYQGDGPAKGSSEVRLGRFSDGRKYVASVEPWHGFQVVSYTAPESGEGPWERLVMDHDVAGGHALWCADLDGDRSDELIVAQRDPDHDLSQPPHGSRILVYTWGSEGRMPTFERHVVDDGGIAAEDLVAADLDGDGKVDLVAAGRETHNVRIYWNRGGNGP